MANLMQEEELRKKVTLAMILRLHHSVIAKDAIPTIIAESKKENEKEHNHEHDGVEHGESNA